MSDNWDKEGLPIEGWATRFNKNPNYGSRIDKGCFKNLPDPPHHCAMLFNHQKDKIIGTWTSLEVRSSGLFVKGVVHDKTAIEQIKTKSLSAMSVYIWELKREHTFDTDTYANNKIVKDAKLTEISLCWSPGIDGSRITKFGKPKKALAKKKKK